MKKLILVGFCLFFLVGCSDIDTGNSDSKCNSKNKENCSHKTVIVHIPTIKSNDESHTSTTHDEAPVESHPVVEAHVSVR